MALEKNRGRRPGPGELAVIVGAGRSGKAAAKMLRKNGVKVRLLEKNADSLDPLQMAVLEKEGIEIITGEHKPEHFLNSSFIIPSPGIPVATLKPYFQNRAELISEIELAWRYLDNEPILAVTGTSGKTTTASLAAAMLKSQGYSVFLGGNIGTPLSEYVLDSRTADVIVLEVSSFQLQACNTFCPRCAILLNLSPNHLDYHKSMEEYEEAKFRIFRCQDKNDLAILNSDLKESATQYAIPGLKIWLENKNRFPGSHLLGEHNQYNMEAAWQAARFFGVSEENAARAVAAFHPLPHRLEMIRELNGIRYVNDSKCTTVSALKVALEAFNKPVRLLCGGKFKGGDLKALDDLVRQKVREIGLFGASREIFEEAWKDLLPMSWSPNLAEAVHTLNEHAEPGDVILLAPATSSFDLYKNYEERGDDFRQIVKELS